MAARHVPMRQVLTKLIEEYKIPLENTEAIELFAREGDWHTVVYAPHVKSLEAWEINPEFYEGLSKNLPHAKIKIVDAWEEIKKTNKKYGLIVVDAPQATYGENDEHCEHFGLLPDLFNIANDGCIIILNVNVMPYDLDKNPLWQAERRKYYKTEHPEQLSLSRTIQHYREICIENGFEVLWHFFQQRETGFIYYLVLQLERRNG